MFIPFDKDTLQKLSLIAFAQAVLLMMGETRKVIGFYPTEMIIPTFRHRFMDGVLELEDGVLMNIEFQSGNLTEKFLLRCAQYAINLRIISGRFVESNIISTGFRSKSKLSALISKIFHFKPKVFFYSEFNGLEKLINIKNKISNKEKLTIEDHYNLIFIPLMGNVDRVKVAFEVFKIANNSKLFTKDEQSEIKKCQFVVAQIIADGDEELLNEFWGIIMLNNDFLAKYEMDLIKKTTDEVTEKVTHEVTEKVTDEVTEKVTHEVTEKVTDEVTENVSKSIAKNVKGLLSDSQIAEATGLSIETVENL